ncbi:hypothetical protein [Flavihumibacter fluvii]|uniref:hypothetical protein n=1 Tax=Flavihumibacter fluvii TaxID=2838157 RepID=UPI001BDE6B46|nr:hypothetical protein [Flavihumibacter fluvii]ULQ54242.1 hypothetical protein KJS93_07915 [Flavihumibacter fluvii]
MIIKTGRHRLLLLISFVLIYFLFIQVSSNNQPEQLPQSTIQQGDSPVDLPVSPFRLLELTNYPSPY